LNLQQQLVKQHVVMGQGICCSQAAFHMTVKHITSNSKTKM